MWQANTETFKGEFRRLPSLTLCMEGAQISGILLKKRGWRKRTGFPRGYPFLSVSPAGS